MARTLLLRAADAGDTYITWTWLERPDHPQYHRVTAATCRAATHALATALPYPVSRTESSADAQDRAFADAAGFADLAAETKLTARLARALLPEGLAADLADTEGEAVDIRITPSPSVARVPWELLPLPDSRRLIEVATCRYDLPATVKPRHRHGSRQAVSGSPLRVIDPVIHSQEAGLGAVLEHPDALRAAFPDALVCRHIDRDLFAKLLGDQPSRLLYFGHVTSNLDEPGSAALHLSDGDAGDGVASPAGGHRPLSALDLLAGAERQAAVLRWPMPARVALIACESAADLRTAEPFGLLTAAVIAGAELVTATRWTLPSDQPFADRGAGQPTTALLRAVDEAHESADPVRQLTEWQRRRLREWRRSGDINDSPMVWASLATYTVPI